MVKYEYKNTGIEWLSNIPKHWKATSIKKEFRVIPSNVDKKSADDETEVKLCNYVDVYYNDFLDSSIDYMIATANDGEIQKFKLNVNDVLITKDSEDPFDIAVPAVITETQDNFICGYHLSMIRSINQKIDGKFLFWAIKDEAIASQLYREATGVTRWAIASRHIKNSTIPFPPLPEQRAIADYLDKACKRIDSIIDIKQKQLERIEGYLITKITDWVTKGLSLSETETTNCLWIPEIKKGWKIKSLKRMLAQKLKYGANESAENENYDEPRYIRITDFGDDGNLKDDTFKSLPLEIAEPYMLQEGDVLFARSGATVGKTFIFRNYNGLACYAGYLIKANCDRSQLLPEYLYYFTKSKAYQEWKNIIFTQATIQNIGADKYQYLLLPQPTIDEQKEIIKAIKSLWGKTENLKNKLNAQINTLQTYRKSLIHECVTGKKQIWEGEII
ncbi:MAG: restriction endonuclease subunit S [Bacteroidales bacterium]|jgi:restriction endonuclease S subunit|nr:restriction endonuclease subunit S [Bacteroidales bacterium]